MSSFKFFSMIVFCSIGGGVLTATDFPFVTTESESLYGKGIHAFFDRDYEAAIVILSKAEEIKTDDPRPYYFWGLAQLRQQKTEQAEQSFRKAAQLEFGKRSLRDYAVSESLRRIQGDERMRIEKIRTEERENAWAKERRLREMRYSKEHAAARENLRQNTGSAKLQNLADELSESAFSVKPIDPINTVRENIVPPRAATRMLGKVTPVSTTKPEIPAKTTETPESSDQETDDPEPEPDQDQTDVSTE